MTQGERSLLAKSETTVAKKKIIETIMTDYKPLKKIGIKKKSILRI